jgi:hypothetical protein
MRHLINCQLPVFWSVSLCWHFSLFLYFYASFLHPKCTHIVKLFHENKRKCFATWQRILTNTTVIISLPWNTYKKCLECAFPPGIFHLFFTDIYNYYSLSKFCDLLTENWNITLLLTEAGKSHQTHWWFLTFRG